MKTYLIVDATVNHSTAGKIVKENIIYYNEKGEVELIEGWSKKGEVFGALRPNYQSKNGIEIVKKIDLSNIDINTLPEDQLELLVQKINQKLNL